MRENKVNHEIHTRKRINNGENKVGVGVVISQYSSVVRRYRSKIERDGRRRQSGETQKI